MAIDAEMRLPSQSRRRTMLALVAAALVVSVGVIGYVVYDNSLRHDSDSPDMIEMGDAVTMDYIGSFSDGHVFDTSILSVAQDDVLYPKSLTFAMRDNESYKPFDMVAGKYGEEGGTIKGFALGVIGLYVGDETVIEVAPEDAYAVDPNMLETIPLEERVIGTETMPEGTFSDLFRVDPTVMAHVPHYKWGWDVLVTEMSFGLVTFKHFPTVGEIVYPFGDPMDDEDPQGWSCVVESFDSEADGGIGEVVVRHNVDAGDVYAIKGETYQGEPFVISSFDGENQTFEIHKSNPQIGYNGEIAGRTLYFEVTIISIAKT